MRWPQSDAPAQPDFTGLSEKYFLDQAAEMPPSPATSMRPSQFFQSAIIYAPTDPVPYHRLGQFYARNGQRELAHQYFGLALNVQPAYAPALRGLALLDLAAGNRAGAEAQHEILLHACGATCPETAQVETGLNADRRHARELGHASSPGH